jgi:hypothetical protein
MRHADHERREHEWSDDHFNEAKENVGEQRNVVGDSVRALRARVCRWQEGLTAEAE